MKKSNIIIVSIIVVCGAVALFSFKGILTPYVSFDEAAKGEAYVQVLGKLVKSVPVQNSADGFIFTIEDDNAKRLTVIHKGSKPLNFEHATSVVAIGTYNKEKQIFEADKILVKCPSKYTKENK
ncbi:MAG TPA: cytochrome c maturation protein CcmE [Spirochaetota bacterium]|nr:cytochrome c maturation protein CcmE [Spirochaetota bacterium]HOM10122.1 cytochrome c maturation protein CcmE [Spirochaetota bacterium]HPP50691.1 cytochrome c maturation protein CcmE [Spirochaetota bacterium]HXK65828.1 cytochrome c maturation protein CcmE [Spirochaetota bacterium]